MVQPQEREWKIGDKAIYQHEVVTIQTDLRDRRFRSVTNGVFDMGGVRDNELFPVTEAGMEIANFFEGQKNDIRKLPGSYILDWPTISDVIVQKFEAAMRDYENNEMKSIAQIKPIAKHIMEATLFFAELRVYLKLVTDLKIDGNRVFSNRASH